MTHKAYALVLLCLLLSALFAVVAINGIVDPYWYFRFVEKRGFNLDKPHAHGSERLVKSAYMAKSQPNAIILGSSFAEIGLPATHNGFTDGGALKPYNLSLAGAQAGELYCYALFALAQPSIKRLVLGGITSEEYSCEQYADLGRVDYAKLLLSKTALDHSLSTIRSQDGTPEVTPEGTWYFNRYNKKIRTQKDIVQTFAWDMRHGHCDKPDKSYVFDPRRVKRSKPPHDHTTEGLRKLIRLAIQRDVQLVLISFPKHVFYYERRRQCGNLEADWSSLWTMASVIEEEVGHDSTQVKLWDFHSYQDINAERLLTDLPMRQRMWQDSGHFNHEVGEIVFDAIFRSTTFYGKRINTRNFDQALMQFERERDVFMAKNPWVEHEMDEIYRLEMLNLPSL